MSESNRSRARSREHIAAIMDPTVNSEAALAEHREVCLREAAAALAVEQGGTTEKKQLTT